MSDAVPRIDNNEDSDEGDKKQKAVSAVASRDKDNAFQIRSLRANTVPEPESMFHSEGAHRLEHKLAKASTCMFEWQARTL